MMIGLKRTCRIISPMHSPLVTPSASAISFPVQWPKVSPPSGIIAIEGPPGLAPIENNTLGNHCMLTALAIQGLHQVFSSAPNRWLIHPQPSTVILNEQFTASCNVLSPAQWVHRLSQIFSLPVTLASPIEQLYTLTQVADHHAQNSAGTHPAHPYWPLYYNTDSLASTLHQWQQQLLASPKQRNDLPDWFTPLIEPFLKQLAIQNKAPLAQIIHHLINMLSENHHAVLSAAMPLSAVCQWEQLPHHIQLLVNLMSHHTPIIVTQTQIPHEFAHQPILPIESPVHRICLESAPKTLVAKAIWCHQSSDKTKYQAIQGKICCADTGLKTLESCLQEELNNLYSKVVSHNRQQAVSLAIITPPQSDASQQTPQERAAQQHHDPASPWVIYHLKKFVTHQLSSTSHSASIFDYHQPDTPSQWPELGILSTVLSHNFTLDTVSSVEELWEKLEISPLNEHTANTLTHLGRQVGQWPDGFSTWAWQVWRCFPEIQKHWIKHPKKLTALQVGLNQLDKLSHTQLSQWLCTPQHLYRAWPEQPARWNNHGAAACIPDITIEWHTPHSVLNSHQRFTYMLWLDADTIANAISEQHPDEAMLTVFKTCSRAHQRITLLRWCDANHTPLHPSGHILSLQTRCPDLFTPSHPAKDIHLKHLNPALTAPITDAPTQQWRHWQKPAFTKSDAPVIAPEERLSISASGINNYMRCPRQYFYSQLLQLRGEPSDKAQAGTLMHRLLEALNTQFPQQPYSAQTLRMLFTQYLNPDDPTFTEADRSLYFDRTRTEQADLKRRISQTILDLEQSGYFETYQPSQTMGERRFGFEHPAIKNTRFQGSIDALLAIKHSHKACWHVLDYKHESPSKWRSKEATHLKHLSTALTPLPSSKNNDQHLSHTKKFGDQDKRNYQIPLYYWATQYDESLAPQLKQNASVSRVGLQVVRPPIDGPNGDHRGSQSIMLLASEIQQAETTVVNTLTDHILKPIRQHRTFQAETGNHCAYCPHRYICPEADALNQGQ